MAKILLFDIETSPMLVWGWNLWSEPGSMIAVERDWHLLCWSAKWLKDKKIYSSALPDFKQYKKDPYNDKYILLELKKLFDKADIIVSHNGKKFDHRKVNARFLHHGILPASPYKIVDTLELIKKVCKFSSHKLQDLSISLGLGSKVETEGLPLWIKCIKQDMKAWKKMIKYCRKDTLLLEKLYLKILPYIHHPNLSNYNDSEKPICSSCGSSNIMYSGYYYTTMCKYHRFICKDCGTWGRLRKNLNTKSELFKQGKNKTLTSRAN